MTVAENKFDKVELHIVLNTMGRLGLDSVEKDKVGKILAQAKENGSTINESIVLNAISECRTGSKNDNLNVGNSNRKSISSIG
jgi:hypothetical protein